MIPCSRPNKRASNLLTNASRNSERLKAESTENGPWKRHATTSEVVVTTGIQEACTKTEPRFPADQPVVGWRIDEICKGIQEMETTTSGASGGK